MPSDVLQQIDEEKQKLSSSGEIDPSLSSSLDELNEKASKSAQVMSVIESIWNSTASSGKNLHERISDLVKDFQVYEEIIEKSVQGTSRLGSEYGSLGTSGSSGINRINESLIQSLSLLQTVEREVQKYQSILASSPTIPSPNVSSASPPIQKFANGGRVQGISKKGDKNLARVNAGEWVFTEKQVDNLRKITGASSSVEVFRMSGGIPGKSRKDSSGIPMYAEGKIGDSLQGRRINTQLSSARTQIEERFNNSRTYESTKTNLESLDASLREFDDTLKNLNKTDFDRLGIDKRIENIFQKLSQGTKNGSRELQSITKQINAVISIVNQDAEAIRQAEEQKAEAIRQAEEAKAKAARQAEEQKAEAIRQAEEATRQAQLALDAIVKTDLSKFSGEARYFAESLEKAKNISESKHATDEEKEIAKKEIQSSKSMLDFSQQKYLTRTERAQRRDLTERYKKAGSTEEKEAIAQEATKITEDISSLDRSITLSDSAWIKFNKDIDEGYESVQKFWNGTPVGMTAVAAAVVYVGNEMSKTINSFSDATLQMAKLNIETANTRSSFDSLFGSGQYELFADSMSLTREEMANLAPVITDAYRSAGVEMEHISMIAENIKNSFGELSPEKLKEALSVMSELTSDQQKILLTGNGSSEDRSSMYANLMESGKAGQAADLLEQGVFGEKEDANLNEGDKAIVESLRELKTIEDSIKSSLVENFGGLLGVIVSGAKVVGTIASGVSQFYAMSRIVGVGIKTLQGINTKIQSPMPVIDSTPNTGSGAGNVPGGGGNVPGGGGKGGGMAGSMIASAITSIAVAGFAAMQEHFEKEAKIAQAKKDSEIKKTESQTGIYSGGADLSVDWDKVNARGAKYAAWGAGIGGTIGGIAGGVSGSIVPFAGTAAGAAIGAAGGAAAGGAAGYAIGAGLELEEQLGDNAGNRILYNAEGELDIQMLAGIARTNEYLDKIKEYNKIIQKSEVKSLRLLDTTGIIVKKVKQGKFSKHFDRGIETSQKNIELMGMMGGNDSSYSSNVSTILDNSTKSYNKNLKELAAAQKRIIEEDGANAEAKIQASREVLNQQMEITKKFVKAVYDSIGEYDKIPSVIKNSLQSKIQSMTLDFNNKNAVGTSALNSFVTSGNSRRANQNSVAAAQQYVREKPKADQAVAAAQAQYKEAVSNLRNQTQNLSRLGINGLVREDGTIDETKLGEARNVVNQGLETLDQEAQKRSGIKNYTHTETSIESFETSSGGGWKKIDDKIAEMDEDQFEAARSDIATKICAQLEADIQTMEAIINDPLIDPRIKEEMKIAKAAAASKLKDFSNKKFVAGLKLEDLRKQRGAIKGSYSSGTAAFREAKQRVYADSSYRKKREQLGTASVTLDAAAQAQDAQTMALKNQEKMTRGLINAASDSQKAAEALVNQINNDPMLKFYQARMNVLEAEKGYLMATGNYADYLTGRLSNLNGQLAALTDATNRAKADFDKNQADLQSSMSTVLKQFSGNKSASELVGMISELSSLQQEAVSNPSLNGQVMEKSQAINAYIDRLKASDPNGENKETQDLINQAMLMIGLLTSMNGAGLKIQENQAKARSMQFENFKKIIAGIGRFREQLQYMTWTAAKERNTAQSNLSSANLNVDQVARLSDESRQHNAELYRQDLAGIETERTAMIKSLDEQLAKGLVSPEVYAQQRSIIENKSNQATAEAILKYQQAQVDAAKREYDVKMKIVDLAQRGVDIQLDVAQSIGAPMNTIVALERQRVQLAEDAYNAAHKQYQDLVSSGATQEEIEEAKLKMQKAQADVIKNQVGAQRSMMEKVFGNMIGSFGENAGIMGPNNLARKYGYGYGQSKDGTVTKGGAATGGYRSRIFANNAVGNVTTIGLPKQGGIGSSGAASIPGSGTSTGRQQPPVPKPGSGGPGVTGAGDKTKSDADFAKLGEKFSSEKEGIEATVFWEKKIYNVLVQDLVPGIKGIKSGKGGSGFVDGVTRRVNPRKRNPLVDPNAPKNNGGNGNSGFGTGKGFSHTGNDTQTGDDSSSGESEGGNSKKGEEVPLVSPVPPASPVAKLPIVPPVDEPQQILVRPPIGANENGTIHPLKPFALPIGANAPSLMKYFPQAQTQPQNVFQMNQQQLADWRAQASAGAPSAAPKPAPVQIPASDGIKPVPTGGNGSQQGNIGGKTIIEVQVKFNSQMFEEQVKRITMQNAPAIVSAGTGADKK